MQKLGFFGMKSLDQFKSFTGSASGTAKTLSISSRSSSDSITSGSFANLKITAGSLPKFPFLITENYLLFCAKFDANFREIGQGTSVCENGS